MEPLHHDVEADRQAEPSPFSRRFRGEEGIKDKSANVLWNTGAVVLDLQHDISVLHPSS